MLKHSYALRTVIRELVKATHYVTSCKKVRPRRWPIRVEQDKERMHGPVYTLDRQMLQFA